MSRLLIALHLLRQKAYQFILGVQIILLYDKQRRHKAQYPLRIRNADACTLLYMLIFPGDIFHLDGRHLLAAHIYDIIRTSEHIYISVCISVDHVARSKPTVPQGLCGQLGSVMVSCHHHVSADRHATGMLMIAFKDLPLLIESSHRHAVKGLSHSRYLHRIPRYLRHIAKKRTARLRRSPCVVNHSIGKLCSQTLTLLHGQ